MIKIQQNKLLHRLFTEAPKGLPDTLQYRATNYYKKVFRIHISQRNVNSSISFWFTSL